MADFQLQEAQIPTRVSEISFEAKSELVPFIVDGQWTGQFIERKTILATAVILDQNGAIIKVHTTTDPDVLINNEKDSTILNILPAKERFVLFMQAKSRHGL